MKLEIFPVYNCDTHGQLFPSRCKCRSRLSCLQKDWNPYMLFTWPLTHLQGTVQLDDASLLLLSLLETLMILACMLITIFGMNI